MNTEASVSTSAAQESQAAAAKKAANPAGILKRSSSYFVDPMMIDDDGDHNTRFELGDIAELATQIKVVLEKDPASGGLLNDIRLRRKADGRYQVIDGRRRFAALKLLLKQGVVFPDGVPAKLVAKDQDAITSIQQMFLANGGKQMLPLEEAAAFKKLKDAGQTLKEIAATVGRKTMHVSQMLALIDADESLKEAVASGKIGKQLAKNIASTTKGDKAKQKELAAEAVAIGKNTKDGKKRRALLKNIDDAKVQKAAAKGKTLKMRALTDDQLAELGEKLSKHLVVLMKEAGLKADTDLRAWAASSEATAAAFTLGALEALKAAAGLKISLEL